MFGDVALVGFVEVLGGFATCVGLLFVLIGWGWVIFRRITQRESYSHFPLWLFTIAVLCFPVLWVVYGYFPTNIQGMYFGERKMSHVYTSGNIILVLLLDGISIACAIRGRGLARIAVMIGAIAMLVIYAVGIAILHFDLNPPSWLK